jgi:threonine/homoserine/homoserine lactone efflux protein
MSFNIIGYLIFAVVTSYTPGPNNLMLFSYGKAYGVKNARGVMFGIFLGFLIELYLAGYGVAGILTSNPTARTILKIIGSLWMLYLAWILRRINMSSVPDQQPKIGFPQSFAQQFVNPKAWIMVISGASAFMPQLGNIHLDVFVYALIFSIVGAPSMITWLKAGDVIARFVKSERHNVIVGYTMVVLMLVSIVTIWM